MHISKKAYEFCCHVFNSRVFRSRVFHFGYFVPRFPLLRFPLPRFPLPRFPPLLFRAEFSTPAFSAPPWRGQTMAIVVLEPVAGSGSGALSGVWGRAFVDGSGGGGDASFVVHFLSTIDGPQVKISNEKLSAVCAPLVLVNGWGRGRSAPTWIRQCLS